MKHIWFWEKVFAIPKDKFQKLMEGDRWMPEQLAEMDKLCGEGKEKT